jgi:alpha-soluble NSF attachment protein
MSALSQAQRKKGEAFLAEAEATLKKSTWFASSTERKNEDAAELYVKAANAYKVGAWHDEAADAYVKASELFKTLKNLGEASKALSDAGACYKKGGTNMTRAIECWSDAVTLLCDAGRLNMAAKLSKEIAEALENNLAEEEGGNNDSVAAAIQSYQQAADLFEMEQAKSQASGCLQKIAELSSAALNPPDLLKAAELYESLGRTCLESNLLKYNAKAHFLNGETFLSASIPRRLIRCHLISPLRK